MFRQRWVAVAGAVLALIGATFHGAPCCAATISYGNFGPVPPGVTFADVRESSATDPVPLFGPPAPFSAGLDFDPLSFAASASAGSLDITDGQLNFTIRSDPSVGISNVNLFEAGDYSLAGAGSAATQALAAAIMRLTVVQIDGVDVAPINLVPVNASVGFNLLANPSVLQPWSLGLGANVAAQLDPNQRATGIEVVIDNQLLALSEPNSLAFIAKKEFRIGVETIGTRQVVPEPSAALLALIGCLGCGLVVRAHDRA